MNYDQIRTSLKKARLALDKLELLEPLLEQHGASDDGTISEALSDFTLSLHHLVKAVPEKLLPPMLQKGNAIHAKVAEVSAPMDLSKVLAQTESRLQSFIEETIREEIEKAMRQLSTTPTRADADTFTSETADAVRRSEARLRTSSTPRRLAFALPTKTAYLSMSMTLIAAFTATHPPNLLASISRKLFLPIKFNSGATCTTSICA
jgi:hypothetical protein